MENLSTDLYGYIELKIAEWFAGTKADTIPRIVRATITKWAIEDYKPGIPESED